MGASGGAVLAPVQTPTNVVIDTNVVLDLWVFQDSAQADLLTAIETGHMRWLATPVMLEELAFVLRRPGLQPWLDKAGLSVAQCLDRVNARVLMAPIGLPCGFRCKDPSDQCFIDLAVATQACLISKDKAVLRLASRLARVGVAVGPSLHSVAGITNPYPT